MTLNYITVSEMNNNSVERCRMFKPKQVIFEKGTRDYELGRKLYDEFIKKDGVTVVEAPLNKVKSYLGDDTVRQFYENGKQTLVISKKKPGEFQTCKPSADYMLPLVSGCMGQCEYCYLHTQLGDKPYVRVNINVEEILEKAKEYIDSQPDKITTFEGAATSDPLCVEPYTGSLKKAIEFFAKEPRGSFRFVTKYSDVDSLVPLEHQGKTEVRFSINTDRIRNEYEHFTANIPSRLDAAGKMIKAGYPVGFLIAPVFIYDQWEEEYELLLQNLAQRILEKIEHQIYFEVISHRYTPRAKNLISELFPESTLPMKDEERKYKYGQFGYGKYVYTKEDMQRIRTFFQENLPKYFPECEIKYIV